MRLYLLVLNVIKNKPAKKSTVSCPDCSSQITPTEQQYVLYFAAHKPFQCSGCQTNFRLGNVQRWSFFLFGCAGLLLGIFLGPIREEMDRNPNLQNIILFLVLIATLANVFFLAADKKTHVVEKGDVRDRLIHLVSHYLPVIAILVSGVSFYILKTSGAW